MLLDVFPICLLFFFNDTATTEIYTLSLHDALPIYLPLERHLALELRECLAHVGSGLGEHGRDRREQLQLRSEEHTSELQSQSNLVCRLLLEQKSSSEEHTSKLQSQSNIVMRLMHEQ